LPPAVQYCDQGRANLQHVRAAHAPNDGRVVSNFIVQALQGRNITIYGDGSQTRSFCYVDDLIEGMLRMMSTPPEVTGPINIGNPWEFTIGELAELVVELTASKSKLNFEPLPSDDHNQRQPDISRVKDVLGWEPKIQLREGLAKTITYFDETLSERSISALTASGVS
jgi:UDP-glucuronate decarboxylase